MSSNKRKRDVTYGKQRPQQSRLDQLRQDMFNPDNESAEHNLPPPLPANKPRSQREATMVAEPNDEDVDMVVMVTGCSRVDAVRYLKVKSNNVERAVNAVIDHEDISKDEQATQWDEHAFSQDRDGNTTQNREGSLRPLGTSAAPTRGPSPAGSFRRPENQQQEDDELAQALAMSQQDAGFQQETGVIDHEGKSIAEFGPATRKEYDEKQWGMVPLLQASSEVVPDVDVEHRKNTPGEPRFLMHLPSGDYLPNFLTICHAIPAAREALLLRDYTMSTYGADPEWWRGHGIALPKIVHTGDGMAANPDIDRHDEFIAETQRLMAFLDGSERSYASASALANTDTLRRSSAPNMVEAFIKEFIEAAQASCGKRGEMMALFSTNVGTTAPEGMSTPYLEVVDMPIEVTEGAKLGLMELLDNLLWETDPVDAVMSDNFIQQGADVLVIRPRQRIASNGPLCVEVPSQLYLDMYLEDNIDISKGMRLAIAQQKKRAAKLDEIEKKLQMWKHPQRSTPVEAKAMLMHTLGHFSGKNLMDSDQTDEENGIIVDGSSKPEHPYYADIAKKLEGIINSVDEKLAKLTLEKEKIRDEISRISNSSPPQLVQDGLKERYTLMGVATKPSITYVLQPKPEDEEDELNSLDNDGDQTPAGMQWWRIEYVVNSASSRVDKTKVPDYDVLRAVELEHHSALLVYASDRAIDDTHLHTALPEPLKRFVEEDNDLFLADLQDAASSRPPPSYDHANGYDEPRQSIEHDIRRHSFGSTTAQGGESPDAPSYYEDATHFSQHPSFGLPPEINAGPYPEDDPEVAEIHLSPREEEGERGMEMAEKGGRGGLFIGAQPQQGVEGDVSDAGVLDKGIGNGKHVENSRK